MTKWSCTKFEGKYFQPAIGWEGLISAWSRRPGPCNCQLQYRWPARSRPGPRRRLRDSGEKYRGVTDRIFSGKRVYTCLLQSAVDKKYCLVWLLSILSVWCCWCIPGRVRWGQENWHVTCLSLCQYSTLTYSSIERKHVYYKMSHSPSSLNSHFDNKSPGQCLFWSQWYPWYDLALVSCQSSYNLFAVLASQNCAIFLSSCTLSLSWKFLKSEHKIVIFS